jgi:hypothetical protein
MNLHGILGTLAGVLAVALCGVSAMAEEGLLQLSVKPGRLYELQVPAPDAVPVGTRWEKGAVDAKGQASPLAPMFRKQFIIKGDDLATWSLPAFQRFAKFIEACDAKADLGIIPAQSGPEVFAWGKTLDFKRFEIWNHTLTHGKDGIPCHYHQPYDVQARNLETAHRKVLDETGITMHTFCGGGIKYQGQGVHDQDDVTHWVVRNHPDYKVHFHASLKFADRGYGAINSDGVFMPWRYSWFENEWLNEKDDPRFIAQLRKRWPEIDWNRPPALGNADEMIWRFEHPFWNVPESGQITHMVAQFHPASWDDAKLPALGRLIEHIRSKGDWQFANAYETYQWLRDRDDFALTKTAERQYLLDAKAIRSEHILNLRLPKETVVKEQVWCEK